LRIGIFTGNRAEYGLFQPIIEELCQRPVFECHLVVAASHLQKEYGETIKEIQTQKMHSVTQVPVKSLTRDNTFTPKAIAEIMRDCAEAWSNIKPDIVLIYADRFESFAALVASTQMGIITAHIEGGDKTEGGTFDDSVRHAMTKLAHLHFVTNPDSYRRILALGEEEWRVKNVGFGVIDLITKQSFADEIEVISKLKLDASKPIVLFTLHPISSFPLDASHQIKECSRAIRKLLDIGVQIICTYPNNDIGSDSIILELERIRNLSHDNFYLEKSLGRFLFHGVLALSKDRNRRIALVGNSSSGIKESPAFGIPTVNIGPRQEGRLRGGNVIDSSYDWLDVYKQTLKALYDDEFRKIAHNTNNPYYQGGAGQLICQRLETLEETEKLLLKRITV